MAALEFHIPLSREDLLRQGDRNHYVVSECCTSTELTSKTEDCRSLLATGGPSAIEECFDIFYSVLRNFNNVTPAVREEYWHIALQALSDHCKAIGELELDEIVREEKRGIRNTLKMLVYVVVQLTEDFESEATKPDALMAVTGKGRGRKKAVSASVVQRVGGMDWSQERVEVMEVLSQLVELDLHQLWDPPTTQMMEDCSNLIASCCYKLLENPTIGREKTLKEKVFHVMGTLIKKYNQALSVSLKMIQLLQHFEHLVSLLAQAVEMFTNQYGAKNVAAEVVRELGSKDPHDLALDTSGTRCFAAFLVEVTQAVPDAVLPALSVLLPHLSGESYTMRNGVLGVMGEIVSRVFSSPEIDEQARVTRNQLLDKLEEHLHDVNAFVRSKTLQIWLQLFNKKAIPLQRQKGLLGLVVGRLRDKSSNVRKNAVQLLSTFLTGNPFAAKLEEEDFQLKLTAEEERLRSMLPPVTGDEGTGEAVSSQGEAVSSQECEHAGEVAKQMAVVQYLRDGLNFIQMMSQCIPIAVQLLGSKVISDVLESLEFLASAFEFGVRGSREGIRKALVLVWSREQQVKDAVVSTYLRLYLNPQVDNSHLRVAAIVKNLLALTEGATYGDLTSLEEMISLLVGGKHLPPAVVRMLWDTFTGRVPNTTPQDKRAAVFILSMAASADQDIVKSNIDILVMNGLSNGDSPPDLLLAKYTCMALQKLSDGKTQKGQVSGKPFRLPSTHQMFQQMTSILVGELTNLATSQWSPLAKQSITTIYKLSEQPDEVCGSLLRDLSNTVFHSEAPVVAARNAEGGQLPESSSVETLPDTFEPLASSSQDPAQEDLPSSHLTLEEANPLLLSRLLYCAGHVAQCQLVHLEVAISKELKRRRMQQETSKVEGGGGSAVKATPAVPSSAVKGKTPGKKRGANDTPNIEEELGLTGAAADDVESDLMRKVSELEVGGSGLLSHFEPLIVSVVTNPSKYPCPALQASAALTLAKFMLISPSLCDKYLQLLFTILEKSPEPTIRANTIVAVGDLTFRFPNLTEPWTPFLYSRLHDSSPLVRKNSLVVLTHLILNDMVKVKGHISHMALCLEDSEQQTSDLAKLFFHELSKKGNALYNVLPDIISHLSDPQNPLPQETFRSIMKYLFSFIQKDKQCESLVEKLCHRFRATRTERQWHDLAHCLSQLSFTERCVRKLQDNFACFQDKLVNPDVYAAFNTIISKAKKFAKPEVKALVEELERRLQEAHRKGLEDAGVTEPQSQGDASPQQQGEGAGENDDGGEGPAEGKENSPEKEATVFVTPKNTKSRKAPGKSKSSRRPLSETNRVPPTDDNDERISDDDFETDILSSARRTSGKKSVVKKTRPSRSVKKVILQYSSDEDSEEDLPLTTAKSSVRKRRELLLSDEKSAKSRKAPGKSKSSRKPLSETNRVPPTDDDDERISDDDFETDMLSSARRTSGKKSVVKKTRPSRSVKKVILQYSSDEDSEEDLPLTTAKSSVRKRRELLLSDEND